MHAITKYKNCCTIYILPIERFYKPAFHPVHKTANTPTIRPIHRVHSLLDKQVTGLNITKRFFCNKYDIVSYLHKPDVIEPIEIISIKYSHVYFVKDTGIYLTLLLSSQPFGTLSPATCCMALYHTEFLPCRYGLTFPTCDMARFPI